MADQKPALMQGDTVWGDTAADTGVTPRGDTVSAPVSAPVSPSVSGASVVPLSVGDRAGVALRAAADVARDLWFNPGRLLHVAWHGKPESMAEHRAYMKSRAWVPPEMDGGWEKAVTVAGLFYHLVIARPLKAAAKTVDAAADRPLRLLALVVFVIALIVLLARYS